MSFYGRVTFRWGKVLRLFVRTKGVGGGEKVENHWVRASNNTFILLARLQQNPRV